MDSLIENYLKGHLCPEEKNVLHHSIHSNQALKKRAITIALLIRSIKNVAYRENIYKRTKDNAWLNYYVRYSCTIQQQLYNN